MREMTYSTGNVLTCIAFSHGEGPRGWAETIPLVQFMSRENAFVLIGSPEVFVMWAVICGQDLERQFSALVQEVAWPDWDADNDVLVAWYEAYIHHFGPNLTVQALPESLTLENVDIETLMKIHDVAPRLIERLTG